MTALTILFATGLLWGGLQFAYGWLLWYQRRKIRHDLRVEATQRHFAEARNLLMELALRDEISVDSFTFRLFYSLNTAIMRRPDKYPALGAKLRQTLFTRSPDHETLTEESKHWTPGVKQMVIQTSGAMNHIIINHSRFWRWLYRCRWFLAPILEHLVLNRAWFRRLLENRQRRDPMIAEIKATQRGLSDLIAAAA